MQVTLVPDGTMFLAISALSMLASRIVSLGYTDEGKSLS